MSTPGDENTVAVWLRSMTTADLMLLAVEELEWLCIMAGLSDAGETKPRIKALVRALEERAGREVAP